MDASSLRKRIAEWAKANVAEMKAAAQSLNIQHRKNSQSATSSVDAIAAKVAMKYKMPERISFQFPKHLIYVEMGVGKGTPVAKKGQTNRQAKPIIGPVLDKNIDQVADIVADEIGDIICSNLRL